MPLGDIPILLQDGVKCGLYNKCYIFGAYGSGTNLLKGYLEKYFSCDISQDHHVWKHVFNWKLAACERPPLERRILRLVVLKHPVFWIASMLKSPYNFKDLGGGPFVDPNRQVAWTRRGQKMVFENAMSYWNTTISHYLEDVYFRESTYILLYEDLLFRPIEVLNTISKLLTSNSKSFAPIYTSAKNHCNSADRANALRKYSLRNREILREKYRFPQEDFCITRIWRQTDIWIANSRDLIDKSWHEAIEKVERKRGRGNLKYLQRFDRTGSLV